MQKLQYDQGEDRWLCTLMLMAGGRIEFEGSSHCNTFAPEDLGTFYKQRRRWGPSTTANIWELIKNQKIARKNNPYISGPYILYQFTVLIFSMIGLSTTIMMIAEAFSLGVGASLPKWAVYLIVLLPVVLFTVACYISGDGELQLMMATWFSLGKFQTPLIGSETQHFGCSDVGENLLYVGEKSMLIKNVGGDKNLNVCW